MADDQVLAAFRAHVERRISLDDIPVVLRDPWTVAELLKDNTDPMPTSLCVLLRVSPGTIYAHGACELKERILQQAKGEDADNGEGMRK